MNLTRYLLPVLLIVGSAVAEEPKRDAFGDPLPEGAIAMERPSAPSVLSRSAGATGCTLAAAAS
jgi:hypothetical protein